MTSLQITPTFARKTAKIAGTIAAGEHVSVTIVGGNAVKTTTLYLRIVCCGKTIAQFPEPVEEGETQDTWTTSGDDITATLNLNTVEALKYCRSPETGCIAVLEDIGDAEAATPVHPQLYFVSDCTVKSWPQKRTDEEPYSLDDYPGLISQWTTMISNLSASVSKSGSTSTITIVNKDGTTTTAQVADGTSPHIDGSTGHWFIGTTDTGVKARGDDGYVDQVLEGETMKINPSQRQMTDALKKIWQELGGTFVMCFAAICAFGSVCSTNEWQDVPPDIRLCEVASNVVTKSYIEGLGIEAGGISAATATNIADAVASGKRDLTNNVCVADSLSPWSATLPTSPSGGWESQPVIDEGVGKWIWNYDNGSWYAEGDSSDANATSVTFSSFTDTYETKTFTATRSKVAYSNDVFTTYSFVTNAVASAGGGVSTNAVSGIITNHVTSGYLCATEGGGVVSRLCSGVYDAAGYASGNSGWMYIQPEGRFGYYAGPSDYRCGAYLDDISANSVTNGGAKAYADANFLRINSYANGIHYNQEEVPILAETCITFDTSGDPIVVKRKSFLIADRSKLIPDNSPFATSNMTVRVVEANADYALTNLTGAAVTLASGEIGNVALGTEQSTLAVTLDFSGAADRSGDAMLYVVNEADVALSVAPAATVTPVGYDLSEAMGAGTNVVMFTRMKKASGISTVMVTVKEL